MFYNKKMKFLLMKIDRCVPVIHQKQYICKKEYNQQDYYRLKKGFGYSYMKKDELHNINLTCFEWEGNELYLSDRISRSRLLKQGLRIVKQIKYQMNHEYQDSEFDIVLLFDKGTIRLPHSITIRFYKVRNGLHIINKDKLESYKQPILLCNVNSKRF